MSSKPQLRADLHEIAAALAVLFGPDDVVELRIPKTEREGTVSGYFNDYAALSKCAAARNGDTGIYVTLNRVVPALLARAANRVKTCVRTTTSDADIVWRRWLPIDIDPVRPADISSTDAEHEAALECAGTIRVELARGGWSEPVEVDSGNGAHLWYPIDLPNDAASAQLVENVLKVLAARFNNGVVKVDVTLFNAARIIKLPGTATRKGDDTPERPHRLSRMRGLPQSIEPVKRELLEAMAASIAPPPPPPRAPGGAASRTHSKRRFDIDDFIARHLDARPPVEHKGGRKWVLEHCPFDASHQDAAVFEWPDGKLGFQCFHNSCADKHWRDVRALVEPSNGRDEDAPRPEPSASPASESPEEPPSGPELVKSIEQTLRRYVVLPEPAYLPTALWAAGTHAVEQFDCYPYIAATSAVKRSGKTRFLEVLEPLARRSWRGTAPSPAALYRMLESAPTLLLDEVEALNGKKSKQSETTQILLAVLNAGHRKGATIPRCAPPNQEVRHFHVFGPKLFAVIGALPDTLLDRSIVLHMKRRSKAQKVERFRQARAAAAAKPIHDGAARFARTHGADIERAYQDTLEKDLEFLNDRDADLWAPLFAICSVASPERLKDLRTCAVVLSAAKAGDDVDDSYALTLLRDIREVWPRGKDEKEEKNCETAVLLAKLKVLEDSPWLEDQLTPRKLARMLRPFEVEPRNIQIEDRRPKGYLYAELQEAFSLYLPEKRATSATTQ
jgi:hypothetical protein